MVRTDQPRALVLDDDEAVVKTICALAARAGLDARGEIDPDSFLAQSALWNPDFLIVDLLMPTRDGVEIIRALAEQKCGAALILTSGLSSCVLEAARRTAIERGLRVSGVLAKPMTQETLRAVMDAIPTHKPCELETDPACRIASEELQQALDRDQIELMYQPQIHCISGEIVGFEALARWRHPDRGLIMPDRFIRLAERGGLIARLTERIVALALEFLAGTLADTDIGVSINLSMLTLGDLTFADRVAARCAELGVMTKRITFELTETGAMVDPASTLDLLTRLRIKGFRLSIDDFGTGYSSMVQLVRLPFTEIKIDKSFVASALASSESREVVRSVVALGMGLGLEIVAEGIEDPNLLAHVTSLGCDRAQGYYIAKPLRENEIEAWMTSWRTRTASEPIMSAVAS